MVTATPAVVKCECHCNARVHVLLRLNAHSMHAAQRAAACAHGAVHRARALRFIALKNCCSDGYIHTSPPGSWCCGRCGAAMGMLDATRAVLSGGADDELAPPLLFTTGMLMRDACAASAADEAQPAPAMLSLLHACAAPPLTGQPAWCGGRPGGERTRMR